MPAREIIGYTLALAGLGCAVTAAALQGGAVAAWGAAGAGLTSLAAVMGYSARTLAQPTVTK